MQRRIPAFPPHCGSMIDWLADQRMQPSFPDEATVFSSRRILLFNLCLDRKPLPAYIGAVIQLGKVQERDPTKLQTLRIKLLEHKEMLLVEKSVFQAEFKASLFHDVAGQEAKAQTAAVGWALFHRLMQFEVKTKYSADEMHLLLNSEEYCKLRKYQNLILRLKDCENKIRAIDKKLNIKRFRRRNFHSGVTFEVFAENILDYIRRCRHEENRELIPEEQKFFKLPLTARTPTRLYAIRQELDAVARHTAWHLTKLKNKIKRLLNYSAEEVPWVAIELMTQIEDNIKLKVHAGDYIKPCYAIEILWVENPFYRLIYEYRIYLQTKMECVDRIRAIDDALAELEQARELEASEWPETNTKDNSLNVTTTSSATTPSQSPLNSDDDGEDNNLSVSLRISPAKAGLFSRTQHLSDILKREICLVR